MKFIDQTEIHVKAGDGGNGLVSFRSGPNNPKAGVDGGDGGHGGHVLLRGNPQLNTLSSFRFRKSYKAKNGQPGGPNGRTGANGKDLILEVPLGTIAISEENGEVLAEVTEADQELSIAKGGTRGLGNQRFLKPHHQAPEEYTKGTEGQELTLRLELKLLADVGLAGFPNAGKSTLLSSLSAARPKIADYPFTTLTPQLGVVQLNDSDEYSTDSFVMADIPGLIEGASTGKGLGHEFLKHLERTKVIAFVIGSDQLIEQSLEEIFATLRAELNDFSEMLKNKKYLVVVSKMDLGLEVELPHTIEGNEVLAISAVSGAGLSLLKRKLFELNKSESAAALTKPSKLEAYEMMTPSYTLLHEQRP